MVSFNIEGILAPVFAPFDDSGHLKCEIIPEYLSYLVKNGINGILVGGTTGENSSLCLEERKTVLKAWVNAAKAYHVKVVAQVGGVCFPDVIELAQLAEEIGADAIMTLPEIYYKPKTSQQLVKYLEKVSNAAPSLPLIYYHFPLMSGVELNIPQFFELASSKISNFKGMKADLDVAVQVADQLAKDQRIFIANHLLAPAALLGHDSSIATVTNILPNLVKNIVECTKNGKLTEARTSQEELNRIVKIIISEGEFVTTMKAAMEIVTGINVGPTRMPLSPLEGEQKNRIKENLTALGIKTYQ